MERALTRFLAKRPQIRAQIARSDPEQVVRDVLAGRCDLGVAGPSPASRDAQLLYEPLPPHSIHLFARPNHPLAARRGLRLAELLAFPLVSSRVRGTSAAQLSTGPAGRIDPDTGDFLPAITVDSLDLGRRIAASTAAILPAVIGTVASDLREGRLIQLDFREPWMETAYGLLRRRDRTTSPAARAFVDELRAVEAEVARDSAALGAVSMATRRPPRRARVRAGASSGRD